MQNSNLLHFLENLPIKNPNFGQNHIFPNNFCIDSTIQFKGKSKEKNIQNYQIKECVFDKVLSNINAATKIHSELKLIFKPIPKQQTMELFFFEKPLDSNPIGTKNSEKNKKRYFFYNFIIF